MPRLWGPDRSADVYKRQPLTEAPPSRAKSWAAPGEEARGRRKIPQPCPSALAATSPVSYTHLDVYKRQIIHRLKELGYVHTVRSAKKLIDRKTPEVWDILEEVTKGHQMCIRDSPRGGNLQRRPSGHLQAQIRQRVQGRNGLYGSCLLYTSRCV